MIGRRVFLAGAGLLGAGALGYGGSLVACAGDRRAAMIRPLFQVIPRLHAPNTIGLAWLQVETPDDIVEGLMAHPMLMQTALLPDHTGTQAEHLMQAIRADFRQGDTVALDRWVVTRSEARIAAAWRMS